MSMLLNFAHFDLNEKMLSNLCCILGNFRSSLLSDPLIRKKNHTNNVESSIK